MAKLLYQGHGSFRVTANDGRIMYIDPYAGEGYELPADIVLITHEHGDHNQIKLVTQKQSCRVITNEEALSGGKHNSFDLDGIGVRAVTAENKNHDPAKCVGFIISIDGVTLYIAGDTSKTAQMADFAADALDYAFLPIDGVYNMGPEEASECAKLIAAKNSVPVHMKAGALFDRECAERFVAEGRLILEPGDEINL